MMSSPVSMDISVYEERQGWTVSRVVLLVALAGYLALRILANLPWWSWGIVVLWSIGGVIVATAAITRSVALHVDDLGISMYRYVWFRPRLVAKVPWSEAYAIVLFLPSGRGAQVLGILKHSEVPPSDEIIPIMEIPQPRVRLSMYGWRINLEKLAQISGKYAPGMRIIDKR